MAEPTSWPELLSWVYQFSEKAFKKTEARSHCDRRPVSIAKLAVAVKACSHSAVLSATLWYHRPPVGSAHWFCLRCSHWHDAVCASRLT